MSDYLDINNEELLKDFFSEAEQQVEQLESNILVIEQDPTNKEAIDEIFRAAHTLKGGSATVEMSELSGFTHAVEDLLDAIRSNKVTVTEDTIDLLLHALDIIKDMLAARSNGEVYSQDVSETVTKLRSNIPDKKDGKKTAPKASQPKPAPKPVVQPQAKAPSSGDENAVDPASLLSEYEILELREAVPADNKVYAIRVQFDEASLMNTVGGIQVFAALKQSAMVLKTIPDFDALYEDEFHPEVLYYVASAETESRRARQPCCRRHQPAEESPRNRVGLGTCHHQLRQTAGRIRGRRTAAGDRGVSRGSAALLLHQRSTYGQDKPY